MAAPAFSTAPFSGEVVGGGEVLSTRVESVASGCTGMMSVFSTQGCEFFKSGAFDWLCWSRELAQ